jgi:hypothetical protein
MVGVGRKDKRGCAGVSRLYQALEVSRGKVEGSLVVEGVVTCNCKEWGGRGEGVQMVTVGLSEFE